MTEYSLNPFELQFLILAAERRTVVKQAYHVRNHRCQHKSDFATHLTGVIGEYAVAKMIGNKLDLAVHIGGDGGSDIEKNGHTIQVKTRNPQREPIYLYVNEPKDLRADVIVLAITRSLTEVSVLGWLPKEDFLAMAVPLNFGHGDRIGVSRINLRPPDELDGFLAQPKRTVAVDA